MVKWIQLDNFKCPACPSNWSSNWICHRDKDEVFLNEEGIMQCKYGWHSGPLLHWKWNCGSEFHNGEFHAADFEGFTFAMSQAVQLTNRAGAEWVAVLLHNIGKQFGKW